jgi:hypothetical protein
MPLNTVNQAQGLLDTMLLMNEELKAEVLDTSRLRQVIEDGNIDLAEWYSILSDYTRALENKLKLKIMKIRAGIGPAGLLLH